MTRHSSIRRLGGVGALALSAALALAACSSSGGTSSNSGATDTNGGSTSAATGGTYLVGAPLPETGPNAQSGAEIWHAEQLAAAQINAKGGVLGHKIVLKEEDAACDPQTSVNAANKLVSQGVKAVVGGYCSGAALPASPVFARAKIPNLLAAANSSALLQQNQTNLFLLDPASSLQATTAANFIAHVLNAKEAQVVDDQSAFGVNVATLVQKNLKAAGVQVPSIQAVPAKQTNFSALINQIKSSGAQAVYFGGYYAESALIVKQMRAANLDVAYIGADGTVDPSFISSAGVSNANGTYASIARTTQFLSGAQAKAFDTAFQAKYNSKPGPYSAYGYDAVEVLAAAATKANSLDPAAVITALHSIKTDGLTGSISFGKDGSRQGAEFVILKVVNGAYVVNSKQPQS